MNVTLVHWQGNFLSTGYGNIFSPSQLFSCFAGMVHSLFPATKQDKVISNYPEAGGSCSRFQH